MEKKGITRGKSDNKKLKEATKAKKHVANVLSPTKRSNIILKPVYKAVRERLDKNAIRDAAVFNYGVHKAELKNRGINLSQAQRDHLSDTFLSAEISATRGKDRISNFQNRVASQFKASVKTRKFPKPLQRGNNSDFNDNKIDDLPLRSSSRFSRHFEGQPLGRPPNSEVKPEPRVFTKIADGIKGLFGNNDQAK